MNKKQKRIADRERYLADKAVIIARLGGKCVACDSTEELEVDHKNREEKSFEVIGKMRSVTPEELDKELAKCQLLCHTCHMEKTIRERGQTSAKGTHGTLSSYRYCKCDICVAAHKAYCTEWNRKAKLNRKRRAYRRNKNV